MQFSGEERIKAPRAEVWDFLTDPYKIAQCAPGLEDDGVQVVDDRHFKVKVRAGVGFIRSVFEFDCEWVERDEPNRAVIRANGNAPGSSVTMTATMALSDAEDGVTAMNAYQSDSYYRYEPNRTLGDLVR